MLCNFFCCFCSDIVVFFCLSFFCIWGFANVTALAVVPVADMITTGSVWQPTDTTSRAATLANDLVGKLLFFPSTIFLASGKEIFCSVQAFWISFSFYHIEQSLEKSCMVFVTVCTFHRVIARGVIVV